MPELTGLTYYNSGRSFQKFSKLRVEALYVRGVYKKDHKSARSKEEDEDCFLIKLT